MLTKLFDFTLGVYIGGIIVASYIIHSICGCLLRDDFLIALSWPYYIVRYILGV